MTSPKSIKQVINRLDDLHSAVEEVIETGKRFNVPADKLFRRTYRAGFKAALDMVRPVVSPRRQNERASK